MTDEAIDAKYAALEDTIEQYEQEVFRLRSIIDGIHGDITGRGKECLVVCGRGYPMPIRDADDIKKRLERELGPEFSPTPQKLLDSAPSDPVYTLGAWQQVPYSSCGDENAIGSYCYQRMNGEGCNITEIFLRDGSHGVLSWACWLRGTGIMGHFDNVDEAKVYLDKTARTFGYSIEPKANL